MKTFISHFLLVISSYIPHILSHFLAAPIPIYSYSPSHPTFNYSFSNLKSTFDGVSLFWKSHRTPILSISWFVVHLLLLTRNPSTSPHLIYIHTLHPITLPHCIYLHTLYPLLSHTASTSTHSIPHSPTLHLPPHTTSPHSPTLPPTLSNHQ